MIKSKELNPIVLMKACREFGYHLYKTLGFGDYQTSQQIYLSAESFWGSDGFALMQKLNSANGLTNVKKFVQDNCASYYYVMTRARVTKLLRDWGEFCLITAGFPNRCDRWKIRNALHSFVVKEIADFLIEDTCEEYVKSDLVSVYDVMSGINQTLTFKFASEFARTQSAFKNLWS